MKKFSFLFLFLFSVNIVLAKEVSLDINEAIALALRDNPVILLKAEDIEKAKAKIKESLSEALPKVSLTSTLSKTNNYYPNKDITSDSLSLSFKQIIYSGGRIVNTIKYTEYGLDIAKIILDEAKLDIVANTKKAFYSLLLAREFVNLNYKILKNIEAHYNSFKIKYNYGEISKTDLLKLKQSLVLARSQYEESLNQLNSFEELLKNLLFLDSDIKIIPEGKLYYKPREISYKEAFLEALKLRPEIKRIDAELKAQEKSIEIVKSQNRPTIYASWDYFNRSHTTSLGGLSKNRNDYNVISLVFSWPIFDGWQTKARLDEALADLRKSKITKEKTKKDIEYELKDSYFKLKTSIYKMRASLLDTNVYFENLKTINEKYLNGEVSYLDKFDNKLKYLISRFNYISSIYEYLIAEVNFDRAIGGY